MVLEKCEINSNFNYLLSFYNLNKTIINGNNEERKMFLTIILMC